MPTEPKLRSLSYTQSEPWWEERENVAPKGAPNILLILLDDCGFADVSCYGSLIRTPNIDAIAADGLRYRNFHVTPMCSPTRAALLSGCNNHNVGMGYLANWDIGQPGYRGRVGKEYGLISETLQLHGYNTFALGKWHLINDELATPAGPFDQWPLGRGFNKFYGFLNACTNQYYPVLINGNEAISAPKSGHEGYHVSEDLADRAIGYIGDTKSAAPDKPFFCYLAFGAQHSPHQVPPEYADRYKGVFDAGWKDCREKVLMRQKELGIVPPDTELAPDDRLVEDWDARTPEERKILARYMEVYAGFMTHTDEQIGRIVDYLKAIGQYENTVIIYTHDNGASAEGGPWGNPNDIYSHAAESTQPMISPDAVDLLGTVDNGGHYPVSWAHVSNTPFQMYKTFSHNGGIKVPLIISYPNGIKDKGGIRGQYHHVTDIFTTLLDIVGLPEEKYINGVRQAPKQGTSMAYTFDDPQAPTRKHVQYYENVGNRGIWADGWKAVADHSVNRTFDFSTDRWELYNTDEDFAEVHDLAKVYPEKLQEMIDLWFEEAGRNKVLPMVESHLKVKEEGFMTKGLFKQRPAEPVKKWIIYPETTGGCVPSLHGSFTATVFADYQAGDEGVLFAKGDNLGGWALFVLDGRLVFHYNHFCFTHFEVRSDRPIPQGKHELAFDFVETAPTCGIGTLLIDGQACGSMRVESRPLFATCYAPFRVGRFPDTSVTGDMQEKGHWSYTGRIQKVVVDFDRPVNDMDRMMQLERELQQE